MRQMVLFVALVAGTLHLNAPSVAVRLNCAVGSHGAERTTLGTLRSWSPADHRSQGHAHNDYEQDRPLVDALDAGLTSVEVDVWAVDGQLLVAHARDDVDPARTLSSLYLDPLRARFGAARTPAPRLQLLIDVKGSPSAVLPLLRAQLLRYTSLLTSYRGCHADPGPVSVVVSGRGVRPGPPTSATSYFGYDLQPERVSEFLSHESVTPLISARWDVFFAWDGHGSMPNDQQARLAEMARAAHDVGSAIRFYDAPDDHRVARGVWRELVEAGVDYIGTDDLSGLGAFLREVDGRPHP